MTSFRLVAAACFAAALAAPPAVAQQAGSPAPQASPPADAEPDDIVVEGYRLRKAPENRTGVPATNGTIENRIKYEFAERLADCAARSRLSDLSRLRVVVDGEINSPRQRAAQDRLVRNYATCGETPSVLSATQIPGTLDNATFSSELAGGSFAAIHPGADVSPLGWSIYDRGALTIAALRRFAPGLTLTRADLADPAVVERFALRETPRNRYRLPADFRYFQVAACMVRLQPRLAVRLAYSEGSARFGDVQEALLDRTRACVGHARKVKVDSTQFRIFVADAVYRWAVAVRNVASLIPSDDQRAAR